MAAIYLIRHGQASFGKANYDQLSDKGIEQSQMLGRAWNSESSPTLCFTGTMKRHSQTHQGFYDGQPNSTVLPTVLSELNEFDHEEILIKYNENWKNVEYMNQLYRQKPDPKASFNEDFVLAIKRWMSDKYPDEYNENWLQFKQRCLNGFEQVIEQSKQSTTKHDHIAVFSSGGTISVILANILGLNDLASLKLNQQIRNTSVSKILFSGNNISVDFFNNYSHLSASGSSWATYR